ncbi:MAG: hypothetical protein ACRCT8_14185 [Lacipirellulaceae bacterium]
MLRNLLFAGIVCAASVAGAASINDLTEWTAIADPAHAGMTSSVGGGGTSATLVATGSIPSGTDVGYASVNGSNVAGSTSGYYFSPASDFEVAIDFNLQSASVVGGVGIGFGIGEDAAGMDSAGLAMAAVNGATVAYGAAGRVNDVDQTPALFATSPTPTGRMFIRYTSATGNVVAGIGVLGAGAPVETQTLASIQNLWDDEPLLVSFFLRSQGVSIVPAHVSGTTTAVFSNFTVLGGTPIAVPEPAALGLLIVAALGLCRRT